MNGSSSSLEISIAWRLISLGTLGHTTPQGADPALQSYHESLTWIDHALTNNTEGMTLAVFDDAEGAFSAKLEVIIQALKNGRNYYTLCYLHNIVVRSGLTAVATALRADIEENRKKWGVECYTLLDIDLGLQR